MMDEVDAKSKPGPYGRREAYRSYHSTLAAEWKGQRVRPSIMVSIRFTNNPSRDDIVLGLRAILAVTIGYINGSNG